MKNKILNGRKTRNTKDTRGKTQTRKRGTGNTKIRFGPVEISLGNSTTLNPLVFVVNLSIWPSCTPVKGIATKITDDSLNTRYVTAITSGLFQFHVAGECWTRGGWLRKWHQTRGKSNRLFRSAMDKMMSYNSCTRQCSSWHDSQIEKGTTTCFCVLLSLLRKFQDGPYNLS